MRGYSITTATSNGTPHIVGSGKERRSYLQQTLTHVKVTFFVEFSGELNKKHDLFHSQPHAEQRRGDLHAPEAANDNGGFMASDDSELIVDNGLFLRQRTCEQKSPSIKHKSSLTTDFTDFTDFCADLF